MNAFGQIGSQNALPSGVPAVFVLPTFVTAPAGAAAPRAAAPRTSAQPTDRLISRPPRRGRTPGLRAPRPRAQGVERLGAGPRGVARELGREPFQRRRPRGVLERRDERSSGRARRVHRDERLASPLLIGGADA